MQKINLAEKFNTFSEHWQPKIIAELNNQKVIIAKVKGDFVNHQHENEDELFFVIEGNLFIELEDQTIELKAGEMLVIPKKTMHRPYAPEEVKLMLFEPKSTLNTGNTINEMTQENLEKI